MGKAILIIIFGFLIAGSVTYIQTSQTRIATNTRQAQYHEEVLAREVARSARGLALKRLQKAGNDYQAALGHINGWVSPGVAKVHGGGITGTYEDGSYEIKAIPVDGRYIKIEAVGMFNDVKEVITWYHEIKPLRVKEPSTMKVTFIESWAGYCSAVYLQQNIPITAGVTFDADTGVVSPDGLWFIKHPEMIFTSGHYRDGTDVEPADITLNTGTQMNFFIGVDIGCKHKGDVVDFGDFDPSLYSYIHYALTADAGISEMEESLVAMVESHTTHDQTWRIAFEDLNHFSNAQLLDIKNNGYGDTTWDSEDETYGGSGWTFQPDGYRDLEDFGGIPDFSDQVIEIELIPCGGPCETPES